MVKAQVTACQSQPEDLRQFEDLTLIRVQITPYEHVIEPNE